MPQPQAPKVLVVDDDPDFRRILQLILEQAGYKVQQASNGREALDLFGSAKPDLLLADVNMPIMDGIELCRGVRAHDAGRKIPVLLITVRSQIDVVREGLDAGATDYILKPFGPDDLLARVERALKACRSE